MATGYSPEDHSHGRRALVFRCRLCSLPRRTTHTFIVCSKVTNWPSSPVNSAPAARSFSWIARAEG